MGNRVVVAVLLSLQAVLLAWGAVRHSPTYDEVAHLPAGLSHWELGDFYLYRVNPPLVRMIAALPVWLVGAETDWNELRKTSRTGSEKRIDFDVGAEFIQINGPRAFWLFTISRLACIPFVTLGGWVVWRWSRDVYGERSSILATTLWSFSPMILGHGQLITPDVAAASMGALVFYSFSRWLADSTWRRAYQVGIALGLAELTKTTWIIAGPLMILLWVGFAWFGERSRWHHAGQLVCTFIVAWFVFVLGYGGADMFKPLGEFEFQSETFTDDDYAVNRFADTWLAGIPVPLPEQYVLGIDVQKSNFESTTLSYLRGDLKSSGWWYYYLYAIGVKSPTGSLLLLILVTSIRLSRVCLGKRLRNSSTGLCKGEWLVILPLLVLVITISSQTGINKHLRYLLPAYPFAIIWISQAARLIVNWKPNYRSAGQVAVSGCVAWSVASSLWIYPHSMSYFNELAGGPRMGDRHLLNSNIDWGQDLFFLRDEIENQKWDKVGVVYWGRYDPRVADVQFTLPVRGPFETGTASRGRSRLLPEPGIYAVSVNHLRGYAFVAPDGRGGLAMPRRNAFTYFQHLQPIGSVGYSIRLFKVTDQDIEALRRRHSMPDAQEIEPVRTTDIALGSTRARSVIAAGAEEAFFVGCVDGSVKRFARAHPSTTQSDGLPARQYALELEVVEPTMNSVHALAYDSPSHRLAIGHADGVVAVAQSNADTLDLPATLLGSHGTSINAIAVSSGGDLVASASDDGTVIIWNVSQRSEVAEIHTDLPATALVWTKSDQLFVGSGDWRSGRRGAIDRYDIDGQFQERLKDSHHFIIDLKLTRDGQLIGRGNGGELSAWDVDSGEKTFTFVGETVRRLALSNDGQWLAGSVSPGTVRLWERSSGDLVFESKLLDHRIEDMAFVGRFNGLIAVDAAGNLYELALRPRISEFSKN